MSAFITRRGGSGGGDVIMGTFTPTSATKATVSDLKGKSRFIVYCQISGESAVGITLINYADGQIRQLYKGLNNSSSPTATYITANTAAAGTATSVAYFDPDTGTIDVSVINSSRGFNTSKTYEYAIFG